MKHTVHIFDDRLECNRGPIAVNPDLPPVIAIAEVIVLHARECPEPLGDYELVIDPGSSAAAHGMTVSDLIETTVAMAGGWPSKERRMITNAHLMGRWTELAIRRTIVGRDGQRQCV